MPVLALLPVILVRAAEMNAAKKEAEMKKDFGIDDKNEDSEKKKGGWGDIGKP